MKLFKDILREYDKHGNRTYSQGRIYLFICVLAYLVVLGFFAIKTVSCNFDISTNAPDSIISALQWAIALFAGYVFGGKGLEVIKAIMGMRNGKSKESGEINKSKDEEPKKDSKKLLNENDAKDGPAI